MGRFIFGLSATKRLFITTGHVGPFRDFTPPVVIPYSSDCTQAGKGRYLALVVNASVVFWSTVVPIFSPHVVPRKSSMKLSEEPLALITQGFPKVPLLGVRVQCSPRHDTICPN